MIDWLIDRLIARSFDWLFDLYSFSLLALQVANEIAPTLQPDMVPATKALPLDEQSFGFGQQQQQQPTLPPMTRTFPPTTPVTHAQPLVAATANQVNKHVSSDALKEQEKDPLKITPEMANKLLKMIQDKGNQFEMTHKAAAQKMQKNISAAAALHDGDSLESKLTSPPAPQAPHTVKNTTIPSQQIAPQQSSQVEDQKAKPVAPVQPEKAQQPLPPQPVSSPSKEIKVGIPLND